MQKAQTDTKKRILDLAQQYVQTRGYNGFSYSNIAEKMGIRKASIHHHFTSKEELVFQVIHRYRRWFAKWDERIQLESPTFWKELDAFFKIYQDIYYAYNMNCPITVLSSELETLPSRIQSELKLLLAEMQHWLESSLKKGKRVGELGTNLDVQIAASFIISTITGFAKYYHLSDNEVSLDQIVTQLKAHLKG